VETVAFFGAGMLGSAMIRAMLQRGLAVHVWNRSPARAQALEEAGAQAFADPAQAALGADRVHLCLYDDASVDSVVDAALASISADAPIVDHTTLLPQRVPDRVARLRDSGHLYLHAPVFMGPPAALTATGVMLASGDASLFKRVREPLQAMCGDLRYLGERADIAAVYKLLGNSMILSVVGGLSDMLRIAEEQQLSRAQAFALFDFFDPGGQVRGRGKRMVEDDYDPIWTLDTARKDAVLMQSAAHHERLPVIDAIEASMRTQSDRGLGDRDLGALAQR
jgi:3-hydroxyisobutyrate dehydrogenase